MVQKKEIKKTIFRLVMNKNLFLDIKKRAKNQAQAQKRQALFYQKYMTLHVPFTKKPSLKNAEQSNYCNLISE